MLLGGYIDGVGNVTAFNRPTGVAVDASGNVLVADKDNNRIRRVTPSGGTVTEPNDVLHSPWFYCLIHVLIIFFVIIRQWFPLLWVVVQAPGSMARVLSPHSVLPQMWPLTPLVI